MRDYKRSAKLTLIITYVFAVLLIVAVIFLPTLVTWYVETKHRPQDLGATVMLTCYPCVPFATVALVSVIKLLKNILKDTIITAQNVKMLNRISICCFCASVILLIAGVFYMPFYIVGAAAATCGMIVRVMKNILQSIYEKSEEKQI